VAKMLLVMVVDGPVEAAAVLAVAPVALYV
jgi:hypothetical protein